MRKIVIKTVSLIVVIVTVCCCFNSVLALNATDVLEFKVSSDGYAIVTDCADNAQGVVNVPSEIKIDGKTYKVKQIGQKAFDSCYNVTEIVIPEGITAIKSKAFRDCVSLKEVYIPESLTVCQYDAFDGCGVVIVHCYRANYQFFAIQGASVNLEIDILDPADEEEPDVEKEENTDFISRFVSALKKMIESILDYFGVNDEGEEEIFKPPFLDDLPFDF